MKNILKDEFVESISVIKDYLYSQEMNDFLSNPLKNHVFIEILKVSYFLGDIDISKEVAIELVKMGDSPFIVMGILEEDDHINDVDWESYPYTEITEEDIYNEEILGFEQDNYIIELK